MVRLLQPDARKSAGFTIVELLIVVVVIAILATITIVAYNGIQNRAKLSAIQSTASQLGKKLALYKIENQDSYPTTEATAETLTGVDITTYTHSINSVTNAHNYCATVTKDGVHYSVSSTSAVPVEGECVTNFAVNPSFESNLIGFTSYYQSGSPNWAGTMSRVTSGGMTGNSFVRITINTVGSAGMNVGIVADASNRLPVTTGDTFSYGVYVRSSRVGVAHGVSMGFWNSSSGWVGSVGPTNDGTITTTGWEHKISANRTITNSSVGLIGPMAYFVSGGVSAQVGDTLDVDGVILTKGEKTYSYGDGNSPGWFWNGTPNNSTSTGPAL